MTDTQTYDDFVAEMRHRADTVHTAIADAICPNGEAGRMVCREGCGEGFPITPADVAQYLRRGWPRHCGREMRWEQVEP